MQTANWRNWSQIKIFESSTGESQSSFKVSVMIEKGMKSKLRKGWVFFADKRGFFFYLTSELKLRVKGNVCVVKRGNNSSTRRTCALV